LPSLVAVAMPECCTGPHSRERQVWTFRPLRRRQEPPRPSSTQLFPSRRQFAEAKPSGTRDAARRLRDLTTPKRRCRSWALGERNGDKVSMCNRLTEAQATWRPGGWSGRHRGAHQWLFVVSGTWPSNRRWQEPRAARSLARLAEPGTSMRSAIPGEEFSRPSISTYSPAYTAEGDERRAGKS
jgi:hypothetical protein